MRMEDHGGGCCGVRHLFGFYEDDDTTLSEVKGFLARTGIQRSGAADINRMSIFERVEGANRKRGKIIEIVLTDDQIQRRPKTCRYLKEYGFKLVHRFDNATGNICNVLHYCFSTLPNERSPFENLPEAEPEPETKELVAVYRINNNTHSDRHHYPKNLFVTIVDSQVGPSDRYRVKPLYHKPHLPDTQLVTPEDISFIRFED